MLIEGFKILQQSFWPRGKILGGTSILNYMAYARGSRHDYDAWESLGATGWNYEEVLPYFKKSENAVAEKLKDSPVHGHNGYLKVDMSEPLEATKWFIEAGKDLGIAICFVFHFFVKLSKTIYKSLTLQKKLFCFKVVVYGNSFCYLSRCSFHYNNCFVTP